jgi:hypothetical protein
MPTRRRAPAKLAQPHARGVSRPAAEARREVLITNAYVIPDETLIARPARPGGARREGAHPDQFAGLARRAGGQQPLRALARGRSWRRVPSCTNCAPMPPIQAELVDTPPVRSPLRRPAHQGHGHRPRAQLHRVDEPRPALGGPQFRDGRRWSTARRWPRTGRLMERDMGVTTAGASKLRADGELRWVDAATPVTLDAATRAQLSGSVCRTCCSSCFHPATTEMA